MNASTENCLETESRHDPELCRCGKDPVEEVETGPACQCTCAECFAKREQVLRLWRLVKLQRRLEKAGIDIGDLADLIWFEFDPGFEGKIEKIVREKVAYFLKDVRLYSTVAWSAIND